MIYQKDHIYHIYNRGCNKGKIFFDKEDYLKLIFIIESSKHKDYVEIWAFSFMPNHYHFLLKQSTDKPIYKWLQYIFNSYAQYFNKRHNRSGTLFEGTAKSNDILQLKYLTKIMHYIHNNPQTDYQKQYSSISMLSSDSFIDLKIFTQYFGNVENYLKDYADYQEDKVIDDIKCYLFDEI